MNCRYKKDYRDKNSKTVPCDSGSSFLRVMNVLRRSLLTLNWIFIHSIELCDVFHGYSYRNADYKLTYRKDNIRTT